MCFNLSQFKTRPLYLFLNSKELNLPISAIGGIQTWRDALHFFLLGGTTVQVTTAVMKCGYRIVEDMIEGLTDYLTQKKIANLQDIIGLSAAKLVVPSKFSSRYQAVLAVLCVNIFARNGIVLQPKKSIQKNTSMRQFSIPNDKFFQSLLKLSLTFNRDRGDKDVIAANIYG